MFIEGKVYDHTDNDWRREQCSLKVLARNSKRRHWYGCAPTCASAGKGQRAKLYIYICVVGANATRVFIAIDLDLNIAHRLPFVPLDTRPQHLTLAVVELGSKALKAAARSSKVTTA